MIHLGPRGKPHRGLQVTEIRVRPVYDPAQPRMLAYVNFTLNGSVAVYGARVLTIDGRALLAMPNRRLFDGGWVSTTFPIDQPTRLWLEQIAFLAYREATEATANRVMEVPA